MALHQTLSTMAVEAVDEYIKAARLSLDFRKQDGGCLGYPSTLLLFCVVNALGSYLKGAEVAIDGRRQKITSGEPFRVLNHECFGLTLKSEEIKKLEKSYRNRLAHNAVIDFGSFLLPNGDGPAFVFESDLLGINVFSFHRLVTEAWSNFPRQCIEDWANNLAAERLRGKSV